MKNFNLGGKWKVEGGRNPPASRLPPSTARSASFTLIEMIGVMAVMGILAAIVVPPLIQRVEDTQRIDEDAALEEIARALVKGIQVAGRFPDPNVNPLSTNGWVGMGSPHSVLGTNAFFYVFPGKANSVRKVYLDGDAVANLSMPAGGWNASLFPSATLMYIVSSSKPDLYTTSTANGSGCQIDGNNYQTNLLRDLKQWRKSYNNTGKIDAPSSVASGWTDRGEYLHVKIVDLKEVLSKVSLEDWHTPVTIDSVDNIGNNQAPNTNPIISQGYIVSWTNSGSVNNPNFVFSVGAQPERASLGIFNNISQAQRYDIFQLSFFVTNSQGTLLSKQIKLRARESAGYGLRTGTNIAVSDFSNPNQSGTTRRESVSFFALRGTSLILYPEADDNNDFQAYTLSKENHRFVFKSGSWGSEE